VPAARACSCGMSGWVGSGGGMSDGHGCGSGGSGSGQRLLVEMAVVDLAELRAAETGEDATAELADNDAVSSSVHRCCISSGR
jgi:hypothetical protein